MRPRRALEHKCSTPNVQPTNVDAASTALVLRMRQSQLSTTNLVFQTVHDVPMLFSTPLGSSGRHVSGNASTGHLHGPHDGFIAFVAGVTHVCLLLYTAMPSDLVT